MAALRPTVASENSANLPNPHVWRPAEDDFRVYIRTSTPGNLTFNPWPDAPSPVTPSSPRWRAPPRTASPSQSRRGKGGGTQQLLGSTSTSSLPPFARPETAPVPLPPPWSRPVSGHVLAGMMTRVASPPATRPPIFISNQAVRRCYTEPKNPPPGVGTVAYPWSSMAKGSPRDAPPKLSTRLHRPQAHAKATYVRGGGGGGPRREHQRYGYTAMGFDVCDEPRRRTIQDERIEWARQRQAGAEIEFHKKTTPQHWGHRHTEPVPTFTRVVTNIGGWATKVDRTANGVQPLYVDSPTRHASSRFGPLRGHAVTPTSFRDVRAPSPSR
jgi:hypothetical protein